jgi:hypothetical protein
MLILILDMVAMLFFAVGADPALLQAGKLLGKLGKQVAAKLADQGWAAGIGGDMEEEAGRSISGNPITLSRAGVPDAGKATAVHMWHFLVVALLPRCSSMLFKWQGNVQAMLY